MAPMQPFDISVSHPIPPPSASPCQFPFVKSPLISGQILRVVVPKVWARQGTAGHGKSGQVRTSQGRSGQGEDEALAKCKCKCRCRCSSILTMGSLPADEGAAAAVQLSRTHLAVHLVGLQHHIIIMTPSV